MAARRRPWPARLARNHPMGSRRRRRRTDAETHPSEGGGSSTDSAGSEPTGFEIGTTGVKNNCLLPIRSSARLWRRPPGRSPPSSRLRARFVRRISLNSAHSEHEAVELARESALPSVGHGGSQRDGRLGEGSSGTAQTGVGPGRRPVSIGSRDGSIDEWTVGRF